ncbi:P-loop containing nucleoside triphosphate hydrolase protein [Ephemerocybe angulata]|uniref:P-loop containing nucleoside triphosphate hydrolase protein n=1 Tax=Ephemerocybe angulata TaxID=980116 RepID=A0A8H6HRI0_9AGAR|nr:P-loop containing nucleoside triphosphate hydrolase protein [Tulosesus angulatus]
MPKRRPQTKEGKDIKKFFKGAAREVQPGDVFIPVLGPTGPGKSTFINNLLGPDAPRKAAVSDGFDSCTRTCSMYFLDGPFARTESYNRVKGRIILVDTPGFDDSSMSEWEALDEVRLSILSLYKMNIEVAGVIYMMPIFPLRATHTDQDNLASFQDLYGGNDFLRVAFVTTRWDIGGRGATPTPKEFEERCEREQQLRAVLGGTRRDAHNALLLRLADNAGSAWAVVDAIIQRLARSQPEQGIRLSYLEKLKDERKGRHSRSSVISDAIVRSFRRFLRF